MPGQLMWGYYPTDNKWVPLKVDADGSIHVVGYVDSLDDIGDVSVATPTDGYVLYWDAATSLWKCKAVSATKLIDADTDTKVDVEESADEDKIHMDVKGVEALLLDDAGILTLAKQSSFGARRTTAQTLTTATWTKVQYNTEDWDIQGEYDPVTNYRFTAKNAGIYIVFLSTCLNGLLDGKRVILDVYKNGASCLRLFDLVVGGTSYAPGGSSGIIQLAAGNYLEAYIYHTQGVDLAIVGDATANRFCAVKVA